MQQELIQDPCEGRPQVLELLLVDRVCQATQINDVSPIVIPWV